ncbi:MAG: hypothetical protein ACLP0J_23040 [Solirubrobacteraceae bacterium]
MRVSSLAADSALNSRRRRPAAWWVDIQRVDVAVYDAIIHTATPSLDRRMSRVTQAADYSRLWLAWAAILATTRGPYGRRAAVVGLASAAATSAAVNLVTKPHPQI